MQLAQIRELAYARAGISPDNANVPTEVMDRFINAALNKASTAFDPFWLETSTTLAVSADDYEYPLTGITRFHKLSRLRDAEYQDLVAIGKHELGRFLQGGTARPRVYTIEEQTLKLAPIPDQAYTLTVIYFEREAELVDEEDEPALPDQYIDWLVCEAAMTAAIKERDFEMYAAISKERNDWIRRIQDDIRQMKAFPRVRVRDMWL